MKRLVVGGLCTAALLFVLIWGAGGSPAWVLVAAGSVVAAVVMQVRMRD